MTPHEPDQTGEIAPQMDLKAHARAVVATWPALNEQDNREITAIAVRHRLRLLREARLRADDEPT